VVIHLARFVDGSRKVVAVSEVTGLEGQVVTMQELFRFQHQGIDANGRVLGRIGPTGIQPTFLERVEELGVSFPAELFTPIRG
jgi:pilus assembly protein CpaF